MVKKKNHEETHTQNVPEDNMTANQSSTETDAPEQSRAKEENTPDGVSEKAEDLYGKLTEMQDKYLRLSAEFDNYRKRTLREKIELTRVAGESVLVSILPVIDDFDRAMISLKETENCAAVKEGLLLIYSKVSDFLKQNGVKEMDVLKNDFDSDLHEAITNVPVDDESMRGKIIDVIQKGYILNDKVIRFPKVVVGE